ncbi:MAG: toprim domain-containing protein, partial [Acidimicrobiales bacterium]
GPIYSKRRTLYGLNWSKKDVVASGEVVVCEGYTDVIAFFLAGLPRAVATCGTALGEDHFRLLRNFAKRVVLAYDADAAGQAGASRVYEWERHHEIDVAVAALPPGSDPADLVRSDPDALRRAVAEARPFLRFRLERVLDEADLSSVEGRAKAAEAAMAVVAEHPNELVRDQYVMFVADRTRMEPQALRALGVTGTSTAKRDGAPVSGGGNPGASRAPRSQSGETQRAGLEALRLLLHRPDDVSERLEPVLFSDVTQRSALEVLRSCEDIHDAIETAESREPQVASLVRRLTVEEPSADADDVVVQLVRFASRRALVELDAQARLSPSRFAELAATSASVKKNIEELDEPDSAASATQWLLAWLVERSEEIA